MCFSSILRILLLWKTSSLISSVSYSGCPALCQQKKIVSYRLHQKDSLPAHEEWAAQSSPCCKWYWYLQYQSVLLFCKIRCHFSRTDWAHSQYRRISITSAVLTERMQICSFMSLFPCPSLLLHCEIHKKELIIGWWKISRTKSERCKKQINYGNSTATDLLLFLNMSFQKYHTFPNLQEKSCNSIKCKSSMQTHSVLLC